MAAFFFIINTSTTISLNVRIGEMHISSYNHMQSFIQQLSRPRYAQMLSEYKLIFSKNVCLLSFCGYSRDRRMPLCYLLRQSGLSLTEYITTACLTEGMSCLVLPKQRPPANPSRGKIAKQPKISFATGRHHADDGVSCNEILYGWRCSTPTIE